MAVERCVLQFFDRRLKVMNASFEIGVANNLSNSRGILWFTSKTFLWAFAHYWVIQKRMIKGLNKQKSSPRDLTPNTAPCSIDQYFPSHCRRFDMRWLGAISRPSVM